MSVKAIQKVNFTLCKGNLDSPNNRKSGDTTFEMAEFEMDRSMMEDG